MLAPLLGALLERRERPFKAFWPLSVPASGACAAEVAAKAAFAASTAFLASCKSASASS